MADHHFQPSSSWWTATAVPCRPDVVSLPATPPLAINCSGVLGRSLDYYDSSVTFQDHHPSAPAIHAPAMDHVHAPHDWSRVYSIGVRSENSFHGLLQEDAMNMEMMNPSDIPSIDQSSSSFALLHGLNLEQLDGGSQSSLDDRTRQLQLQFSGEAPFWSPIATTTEHHNLTPPPQPQPPLHQSSSSYSNNLLETPSTLGTKASMEKGKNTSEPAAPKRARIQTSSPLPLPTTFKVRKEKLGDRITALQQLVSPFGKTDTASVLNEAIGHIGFLHDQVRVLSAPYLKNNGHPVQQILMNLEKSEGCDVQNQDLRSRGMCLVPISSTSFAIANEIPTDFWTPTFIGGDFR